MKDKAKFKGNITQSNLKFSNNLNYIYADSHCFVNGRGIRARACVCVREYVDVSIDFSVYLSLSMLVCIFESEN